MPGAVTTIEASAPSGLGLGVAGKTSPGDQLLLFSASGTLFPAMEISASVLAVEGTQPVAGLVGADGRLVGRALTIMTTAEDMLWDHLLVTPTAHGGVVRVTDKLDGVPRWRIVELDDSGAVALDASLPLPDGDAASVAPHIVATSPRGFAAIVNTGSDGPEKLVEVDRTGSATAGPASTRVDDVPPDEHACPLVRPG